MIVPAGPRRIEPPSAAGPRTSARFEVLEPLGQGGMGRVYRVRDRVAKHECALKRMKAGSELDSFSVQAFEREYSVLVSLNHPRIIRAYDYGVDAEGRYYTMELLHGRDLRALAPLPFTEACCYLRDIATSLSLLHARRLLHRDLSADNVRITDDGHCKLLDFGALTAFGPAADIAGTPPLIAPEVLSRGSLDQRVDLFALGALAYWMLTRTHAFPALDLSELPQHWRQTPPPPSHFVPDIPEPLDQLVLALLRLDPLARPSSAADVIARLSVIGDLPPEDPRETMLLAQSFLKNPPFTGRGPELAQLTERVTAAVRGRGSVVRILSAPGMGRTRQLDEVGIAAQLAGALVLRVDCRTQVSTYGTARALALQLLDKLPDVRSLLDSRALSQLGALGADVHARVLALDALEAPPARGAGFVEASPAEPAADDRAPPSSTRSSERPVLATGAAEQSFALVSRSRPLVIAADDIDAADDASLGFLAGLARLAPAHPMLIVASERLAPAPRQALGLRSLRENAALLELRPFSPDMLLELVRSLFCDPPKLERFAEWLQSRSMGSPLHALELCRKLTAEEVIRYGAGVWTLPAELPEGLFPEALADTLRSNLALLSEPARDLAEVLTVSREQPTIELCRALSPELQELAVRALVDKLVHADVLIAETHGYRFSSGATRDALLSAMDPDRRERHHAQLGEVLAARAADPAACIDAGWHLIEGGAELRGAELIASVSWDGVAPRTLAANLHKIGAPMEAAFLVLGRHRRSAYLKLPLLSALAQAGYYEDRVWAERYGDQAIDLLDELSGLALARDLRRWCGGWLALIIAVFLAYVRFLLAPRAARPYSFAKVFVHFSTTATALVGTATLSMDNERSARVAAVLEPFSVLPARLTPRGIYDFCNALCQVCTDNAASTFASLDLSVQRLGDRRYYPSLPDEGRRLLIAAAHFARAIIGMLHARGGSALESARVLDQTGFELYSMIASQVRFLYYSLRGEFDAAAPHREQVEMHAARTGSLWQVETWEAIVLALSYSILMADTVNATRVVHRLVAVSRRVRSLRIYREIDEYGLNLLHGEARGTAHMAAKFEGLPPRGFLGWSVMLSLIARGFNQLGEHARARAFSERVLACLQPGDRDFFPLFLLAQVELALADAGLGQVEAARARVRAEIEHFEGCEQPLLLGLLYEAAARVAWYAEDLDDFDRCAANVERWFRPTGTPALIAKLEQLQQLRDQPRARPSAARVPASTRPLEDDFGARDTVHTKH